MKNLTLTFIFCFCTLTCLSAQQVNFSANGTFGMSRTELKQAYLEGNIVPALENGEKLAPVTTSRAYELRRAGYDHLENQNLNEARAAFDSYLAIMPGEALAYYCFGDYYRSCQDYHKAAEYYRQAAYLGMTDALTMADAVHEEAMLYRVENEKAGWE